MRIKFLILCLVFVVFTSLPISANEVSVMGTENKTSSKLEKKGLFTASRSRMVAASVTNLEVETNQSVDFTWDSYGASATYVLEKQLNNGSYVTVKDNINTNSVSINNVEIDTNYRVYAIVNGITSSPSNVVKVDFFNGKVFAQHYDHSALSNSTMWLNNTFDGVAYTPVLKNARKGTNGWISLEGNDAFFSVGNAGATAQKIYGYFKPEVDFDSIATRVDDGVRVYVDLNGDNRIDKTTELVIDSWKGQGATTHKSNDLNFRSGEYYLFLIEYFNWGYGGGSVSLEYEYRYSNWIQMDSNWFFVMPNMPFPILSDLKKINSFEFDNVNNTTVIDEANKTIKISVPAGTDLTNLVATVVYEGDGITPLNNLNFSSSINYTVTADDGSTSVYTITVNKGSLSGVVYAQHYDHSSLISRYEWLNNTFDTVLLDPVIKNAIHGYNNWISSSLYNAFLYNVSGKKTSQRLYGYFTPGVNMFAIGSRVDDGIRIYVDLDRNNKIDLVSERVLDSWTLQGAYLHSSNNLNIDVGEPYLFLIEYFNWSDGGAAVSMEYKNRYGHWYIMPQNWFSVEPGMNIPGYSSEKNITSFEFNGINNITTINQNNKTINIVVPFGTDITSLTPTIIFEGESINPIASARNFSSAVSYTIMAEDNSTAVYNVVVTVELDTSCTDCTIEIVDGNFIGGSNLGAKKYNYPINFESQFNLKNPLYNLVMSIDLKNVVLTDSEDIAKNNGVSLFMEYVYPEVVDVSFEKGSSTVDVSYLSQITSNGADGYTVNVIVVDPNAHIKLIGDITVNISIKTDIVFNSKKTNGTVNEDMFILKSGTEYYSLMELPFHIEEQLQLATNALDSFNHNSDIEIESRVKYKSSELGSYINIDPATQKIIFVNRNLVDGE